MENQEPKTGKFAFKFGLIQGAIGIVFGLMLYSMDMHYQNEWPVFIVSIAIMLGVIIFALHQFKKANGGYMTFSQGLKVGLGTALIAGIIGIIFQLIVVYVIDPETMNKAFEYQKGKLLAAGMPLDEVEARLEISKKFSGPAAQIIMGLIMSLFFGFLLTLFPTLIMKKTESEY